jgi:hypothetical protein
MIEQARNEVFNALRERRGYMVEIVERTKELKEGGYTRQYVYLVLKGKRNNIDILNIAVEVLKDYRLKHMRFSRSVADIAPAYRRQMEGALAADVG